MKLIHIIYGFRPQTDNLIGYYTSPFPSLSVEQGNPVCLFVCLFPIWMAIGKTITSFLESLMWWWHGEFSPPNSLKVIILHIVSSATHTFWSFPFIGLQPYMLVAQTDNYLWWCECGCSLGWFFFFSFFMCVSS